MLDKNKYLKLFRQMILTASLTLLVAAGFFSYAAFVNPLSGPSDSDQDFTQNILGANNANNDFDSSGVGGNADGSILERAINIADNMIDYSLQKNQIWDDDKGGTSSTNQGLAFAYANNLDQNEEESTWTTYTDSSLNGTLVASGTVMKDERTKLYWSDCYDSTSGGGSCDTAADNNFTLDGSIADADDGLDAEGGTAVDFCEALSLDADGDTTDETDWYLPSQKEFVQAYIDGIGNNISNPDYRGFTSTESSSNSSNCWMVLPGSGTTSTCTKADTTRYIHCVHRD